MNACLSERQRWILDPLVGVVKVALEGEGVVTPSKMQFQSAIDILVRD